MNRSLTCVCVCVRVHAIASVRRTVVRVHFIGERRVAVATERGATVESNQSHGSQGCAIQRHHCNGIIEREMRVTWSSGSGSGSGSSSQTVQSTEWSNLTDLGVEREDEDGHDANRGQDRVGDNNVCPQRVRRGRLEALPHDAAGLGVSSARRLTCV
jgi:hypothetical protein